MWILLLIPAVIAAALFARIRLRLVYRDELLATLRIFVFTILRYPEAAPPFREWSYSPLLIRLRGRRARRWRLRESREAKKKASRSRFKETEAEAEPERSGGRLSFSDAAGFLSFLRSLLPRSFSRISRWAVIEVRALRITVAAGDAADTAVQYGAAVQGVAYILGLLTDWAGVRLHYAPGRPVAVEADFIGDKFRADVDIEFSIRVWQILALALNAFITITKERVRGAKQ